MVAGFALFFLMQGYDTMGGAIVTAVFHLALVYCALALTVLNLIELVHREEVIFDREQRPVARSEHLVPVMLKLPRWAVAFGEVEAVRFAPSGRGSGMDRGPRHA